MAICNGCGQEARPGASFCGNCGSPLDDQVLSWGVSDTELARVYHVDDVPGWLRRPLRISPNQRALLFIKGEFKGVVEGGNVDMGGLLSRITSLGATKTMVAVVIHQGSVLVPFKLGQVRTADAFSVDVECELRVRVQNEMVFYKAAMGAGDSYGVGDLRRLVFGQLRATVAQALAGVTTEQLRRDASVLASLERDMASRLDLRAAGTGLTVPSLTLTAVTHEGLDQLDEVRERRRLEEMAADDEIEAEEGSYARYVRSSAQEGRRHDAEADALERRIGTRERMRRMVIRDRMGSERAKQDELNFLAEVEKEGYLRQDEVDAVRRALDEGNEDHGIARQHALQLLSMRQAQEVALLQSDHNVELIDADVRRLQADLTRLGVVQAGEQELSLRDLNHEILKRETLIEAEMKEDRTRYEEAQRRRREERVEGTEDWEEERRRDRTTTVDGREDRLADHGVSQTIRADEFDQDLKEMEGLTRIQQERARVEQERRQADERHQDELKSKEHERAEQTAARQHQEHLSIIEAMRGMPIEQLIAVMDDGERASLLQQIRHDEIIAGMSEEQLLALNTAGSPEAAAAIRAKYEAMAGTKSAEERANLMERLVESERSHSAELSAAHQDAAERAARQQTEALQAVKEMGIAAAQAGGTVVLPGAGVAQPGAGAAPSGGSSSSRPVLVCPHCRAENDPGNKHCDNCGERL